MEHERGHAIHCNAAVRESRIAKRDGLRNGALKSSRPGHREMGFSQGFWVMVPDDKVFPAVVFCLKS